MLGFLLDIAAELIGGLVDLWRARWWRQGGETPEGPQYPGSRHP